MPTPAGRDAILDVVSPLIVELSLHSGYPSDTGANEHGNSAYARQPVSWNTASGGLSQMASPAIFDTDEDVYWVGGWGAGSNPDLLEIWPAGGVAQEYGADVQANEIFGMTLGSLPVDTQVVFYGFGPSNQPPSPLIEGEIYWVVTAGASLIVGGAIQVASTQGGGVIDLTATRLQGSGLVSKIEPSLGGVLRQVTVSQLTLHVRF